MKEADVEPQGKLLMDLSKLHANVHYLIRCDLNASDSTLVNFNMDLTKAALTALKMNNKIYAPIPGSATAKVQKNHNKMEATLRFAEKPIYLEVTNLDDTAKIEITNCMATALEY